MRKISLLFSIITINIISINSTIASNTHKLKNNPIITGANFLKIAPDPISGGIGDQGVASKPDIFSQYWNVAKYPFTTETKSISVSYTPYMNNLVKDIFLLNASYYKHLSSDSKDVLSSSLYYFNMGNVDVNVDLDDSNININNIGYVNPKEFSFDLGYSMKLSNNYSMGIVGKYIRSDIHNRKVINESKSANAFAVDLAGYYTSNKIDLNNMNMLVRSGFQFSNIGPKLDYSNTKDKTYYLPAKIRLGLGTDFIFNDKNKFSLSGELSKLMVPTPKYIDKTDIGHHISSILVKNKSVLNSIFSSFNDAPGGIKEELSEIMYSIGGEYNYNNFLSLRGGYFNSSKYKDNRKYFTFGMGVNYNAFNLNLSYLIPSTNNNILNNTLRLGLTWNLGETISQD